MASTRKRLTDIRNLLLTVPGIGTRTRLELLAYLCCFLLGVLVPWIGMQFQGTPEPSTPLAHARLLAAETFASGRLANPSIPGGSLLQTYLTLQEPAYSAVSSPGPALFLALGLLGGDPLLGIWLSAGLLGLSVAWMIRGYASLRWAVIGSLITTIWFGALSFWTQSYDGSVTVAIGLALAWGASRRYRARKQASDLLIFSLGVGWSLLCDPVAAILPLVIPTYIIAKTWWRTRRTAVLAALLPGIGLFVIVQLPLNWATTGHPLTSPASVYRERYDNNPRFLWDMPTLPATIDILRMEQYDAMIQMPSSRLESPVAKTWANRIKETVVFHIGLPALLLLIGAFWIGLTRWARWMLLGALSVLAGTLFILRFSLSNGAGLAIVGILLTIWGIRRIWVAKERDGKDYWRLSGAFLALLLVCAYARGLGVKHDDVVNRHIKYKNELISHLVKKETGRHLVMVQYDHKVPPQVEYVYNSANPEKQDVVWARANDRADPSDLFTHFKDRKTWMILVKVNGAPELRPFKWVQKSQNPPSAEAVNSPDN